jgi:Fe-S cluster biosynthesis and repair protein YggX
MSDNSRIEQFRKMTEADPANELGHFSLGRELLAAGQAEAAANSFAKCLELNPNIAKAYQLQAQALLQLKRDGEAVAKLTEGVRRADDRGEMMPRNEMASMLKELGAPVPSFKSGSADRPLGEGEVQCARCGRIARKLPKPPFSNAQGREIFEKVCADCWREWIPMGTKVINELRLPLNDPQAQKLYDQHMLEFLNLS